MFSSSPFGQRRTRKDWKARKGKNEERFLRAFLRRRVWGVSKDKGHADKMETVKQHIQKKDVGRQFNRSTGEL